MINTQNKISVIDIHITVSDHNKWCNLDFKFCMFIVYYTLITKIKIFIRYNCIGRYSLIS